MNKLLLPVLCLLLLSACHCQKKAARSSAVSHNQTQEEAISAPQEIETILPSTQVLPAKPTQSVNSTDSIQSTAVKMTPPKTAVSIQKKETEEKLSIAPSATLPETATLTAAVPVADTPVFDKEEIIPTDGRLLNPYAALPADMKTKQQAPWAYEQLKYGLYYTFIKAGTAYIRNRGLVDINGRPAYFIQTTAFSAPVIDKVFKVRDINQSWLDAENFYSYGYGQSVREGNYKRDEWIQFDYPQQQYIGQVQKKEEPRKIKQPLDIQVLDMLSALYFVRAQKLEAGQDITFDIVNREKQYPLLVKVLKKDTVKTPAGKFDCIVVEPQLRGEGIFVAKGKSLKVWLTDDEYKMPVKMQVEVFIGSVSAELLEYKRQDPKNIL